MAVSGLLALKKSQLESFLKDIKTNMSSTYMDMSISNDLRIIIDCNFDFTQHIIQFSYNVFYLFKNADIK